MVNYIAVDAHNIHRVMTDLQKCKESYKENGRNKLRFSYITFIMGLESTNHQEYQSLHNLIERN